MYLNCEELYENMIDHMIDHRLCITVIDNSPQLKYVNTAIFQVRQSLI